MTVFPVLGSSIGQIFNPLFQAMAWLIAVFYAVVPNYAIAIALLTVVVMVITAPLTVKSTRSMVAMQRLAPELKKIQQKYKGDRQTLNEEMMKLYKEHNVSPAGGCLPMLIQFPVFIILYDVIRGLTNTVKVGQYESAVPRIKCTATIARNGVCAAPRYIGHGTKLYQNLVAAPGEMKAFGINLASKLLGQHSVVSALPYAAMILIAIGLQYFQMRQLNSRNPQFAQSNPQAQMMQRYMPLIFAVIYINIAAGVNVYFIVSSLCRIGIQEAVFRSGLLDKARAGPEVLPGKAAPTKRKSIMERLADAQARALEAQKQNELGRGAIDADNRPKATGTGGGPGASSGNAKGPGTAKGKPSSGRPPAGAVAGGSNGSSGSNGAKPKPGVSGNGPKASGAKPPSEKTDPQHPRAKAKRARKAR